jgi:hypothetical protein
MGTFIRLVGHLPLPRSVRLDWQARLVDRAYRRDIEVARKRGRREQMHDLKGAHMEELGMMAEERDYLYTRSLTRQARRLRVPIPSPLEGHDRGDDGVYWERGHRMGLLYLTERGIAQLRESIRAEIKWRHEQRHQLVTWLSALTGLIGAITGLLAVWLAAK